jgi:glycosyltransferase involved in cell wall biosynthesis
MSNEPLISIGVPVYNDAPWLRNALDHLLVQDYKNLEIILADDGSIDGSREICREYAKRDKRIRLFENRHNLGGWGNHRFVFDVSLSDFFAWGSGHDYFEPSYISALFEKLNANPTVIQCCPKSQGIVDGKPYKPPGILDTRGLLPLERVKHIMDFRLAGGSMDVFFGLYRSTFLAKVEVGRDVVSADEIMLAELSFMGEILQIDELLIHKANTRGAMKVRANRKSYRAHLDRNKLSKGTIFKEYLPRLYSFVEYMNMVERAPISAEEKEWLHKEIRNVAAKSTKTVMEELNYFIKHFSSELPSHIWYPLVKQIQAAQVLSILDFALLLGFEHSTAYKLRSICLAALGLKKRAKLAKAEYYRHAPKRNIPQTIENYRRSLLNSLKSRLGQK